MSNLVAITWKIPTRNEIAAATEALLTSNSDNPNIDEFDAAATVVNEGWKNKHLLNYCEVFMLIEYCYFNTYQ